MTGIIQIVCFVGLDKSYNSEYGSQAGEYETDNCGSNGPRQPVDAFGLVIIGVSVVKPVIIILPEVRLLSIPGILPEVGLLPILWILPEVGLLPILHLARFHSRHGIFQEGDRDLRLRLQPGDATVAYHKYTGCISQQQQRRPRFALL